MGVIWRVTRLIAHWASQHPLSPGHAGQGWPGRCAGTRWREGWYWLALCRGRGVCREFSLQGLSTPCPPKLPQGEAGRNGAPGEKGPNGLPVSARGSCRGPRDNASGHLPWVPEWGRLQGAVHQGRGGCRSPSPSGGALPLVLYADL